MCASQKIAGSILPLLNIPFVDVVIDFNDAPYEVNETDGVANVTIGVVSGQLMREVVVELSFSDGTAIGKQPLLDDSIGVLIFCKQTVLSSSCVKVRGSLCVLYRI